VQAKTRNALQFCAVATTTIRLQFDGCSMAVRLLIRGIKLIVT